MRPIGAWRAIHSDGVTVDSQDAFCSSAVKQRSTHASLPQHSS